MLARLADALQDAASVVRLRRIRRSAGQIIGGLILLIAGHDAQLVYAGSIGCSIRSRRNQAGSAGHQSDRAFWSLKISRSGGFGEIVACAGVRNFALISLTNRILN